MNHSGRLMWGCMAIVIVAVLLAVAFTTPVYLLFVLPCLVMLGAMLWMMRGTGGGPRDGGGP